MKVQVRLFARYREAAGRDSLDLELPDGGTVERAWEAVARQLPALQPYRPFTLFALRNDYVGADHPLGDGDELCLFPPVSGGSHPVSSPHRGPAFDACRFAIDTLKETVPIWKKEYFEDGEVWVGLQSQCDHRH